MTQIQNLHINMTIMDIKNCSIKKLLLLITLIFLFSSCSGNRKGESFLIENELLMKVIKSTVKGNDAILGFRKLNDESLSFYIIGSPNEICEKYYGSEKVKNLNIHLYIYPDVTSKDLYGYIKLNDKMECVPKISTQMPVPDMMKVTEYIVQNGKFSKL